MEPEIFPLVKIKLVQLITVKATVRGNVALALATVKFANDQPFVVHVSDLLVVLDPINEIERPVAFIAVEPVKFTLSVVSNEPVMVVFVEVQVKPPIFDCDEIVKVLMPEPLIATGKYEEIAELNAVLPSDIVQAPAVMSLLKQVITLLVGVKVVPPKFMVGIFITVPAPEVKAIPPDELNGPTTT